MPSTQRTGVALDLVMRPRSWLLERLSATYTRATFTDSDATYQKGDLVPYAPQLVARADLAVTPRLAELLGRELRGRVGVGLTLLAARPLPYAEMGHDVFLADTTIGLRWREVEVKLDVFNLLGARWFDGEFTYASSFTRGVATGLVPLRHVTVGAPRTLFVGVSLNR